MEKLNISILLVEDDHLSLAMYGKFLSSITDQLYTAENGKEGIEKYMIYKPDIIVSDIKMPVMDGLEMIREIRKGDDTVKIILVSGHQETDYFMKSIEMGVEGYLLKPINLKQFRKLITDLTNTIHLNRKIKETEKRFRDLAELLPEIVFEADLSGKLTFVNKRALEILGCTKSEYEEDLNIFDLLLPPVEMGDRFPEIKNLLSNQYIDKGLEVKVKIKDGNSFPALIYTSLIMKDNIPVGIRGVIVNITTRKENENELKRNQETIEKILQSSPDPIIVTNLNYKIIEHNQAAVTFFNNAFDGNLMEKDFFDIISSEQIEQAKNDHELVLKKGYLKNLEYKLLDKKGGEIYTEISISIIKDKEGKPDLFVSIIKDITERKRMINELQSLNLELESKVQERTKLLTSEIEERKQAEIALKESEEKHSALSKAAFEAIIILENNACIESNQAAVNMFKYNHDELAGVNIIQLISKESQPLLNKYLKSEGEEPLEVMAINKNGIKFPAELQWKKYSYRGKEVRVTAIRDISLRKHTEELLKQRIKFIELIINTSSEFIRLDITQIDQGIQKALMDVSKFTGVDRGYVYLLVPDGTQLELTHEWSEKLVQSREKTTKLIHVSEYELLYRSLANGDIIKINPDNIHSAAVNEILTNKFKTLEIKSMINLPMFIGKKFIGFYGFDSTSHIAEWSDNKIDAYEITGQIIANTIQRKRYDEELIKAKEKAEESDKSKSVFLANISHEIQTPIRAIISFSHLLQSPELSNKRKQEFISIINSNSQALLNLTNDILEFTRLQSNIINLYKIDFDLNLFLKELNTVFNSLKEKRGKDSIKLKLDIPDNDKPLIIYSDPSRLKQIFSNLIGNAFKFTIKGFVEYGYEILEDNTILFHVTDTGLGISKKYQKLIFDRFIQEPKPLNIKKEGTGLGLAITQSLINKLGGKIWIDSDLGKGSTFFFDIPNIIVTDTDQGKHKKYLWQDKQVLIVEKYIRNYIRLEEILKKHTKLMYVTDGIQALEMCKTNKNIDLIMFDSALTNNDKINMFTQLKEINKDITLIIITDDDSFDMEKEPYNQFDDYISKPFNDKKILETLNKYLA